MNVPQTTNCNHRSPADKIDDNYGVNATIRAAKRTQSIATQLMRDSIYHVNGRPGAESSADFGYSGNNPLSQDHA